MDVFHLLIFSFLFSALHQIQVEALTSTFSVVGTSETQMPSPFYCLPQPFKTKTDPLWNLDRKALFYVRVESSDCISESQGEGLENIIVSDDFKLLAKDLAKLNETTEDIETRPIAVLQGSGCVFGKWSYYLADFVKRLDVVKDAGAAGVVFFEAHENKLPQHMTTLQTSIPTCVLAAPELSRLATTVDWKIDDSEHPNHPAFANFEHAYLYNALDEPVPNPIITYIDINHLSAPALTATFNPLNADEVSGFFLLRYPSQATPLKPSFEISARMGCPASGSRRIPHFSELG